MNAEEKDMFRRALLLQMHDGPASGLGAKTLRIGAVAAGYAVELEAVERELGYLVKKGLAEQKRSAVSRARVTYALTAEGIDFLEEEGELG